jgi:hypothetical protein
VGGIIMRGVKYFKKNGHNVDMISVIHPNAVAIFLGSVFDKE